MAGVVLICIDASLQAEAAFEWYIAHIHKEGNALVILHCLDLSAITMQDDSASATKIWDKQKGKYKELESKYRWKLNELGLPGKIRTESGKPGEVVIKIAHEERAGLIVIGSRGLSTLQRTIGGSVSDYVLHHANCAVIICRQQEPNGDTTPTPTPPRIQCQSSSPSSSSSPARHSNKCPQIKCDKTHLKIT